MKSVFHVHIVMHQLYTVLLIKIRISSIIVMSTRRTNLGIPTLAQP